MLKTRVFLRKLATFSVLALFFTTAIGAASTETETLVTGHVTWTNVVGMSECYAAVAGIASNRVLWFNDQVLAENFALGDKHIYVAEAGAPDPRQFKLAFVRNIVFDDPNDVMWNVTEWQYTVAGGANAEAYPAGVRTGPISVPPSGPVDAKVQGNESARAGLYYAWTVRILDAPVKDDYPGTAPDHSLYNFVLIVDVCKFIAEENGRTGLHEDNPDHDPDFTGFEDPDHPYRESHRHKTFAAQILLGNPPNGGGVYVPAEETGFDNDHSAGDHFNPCRPCTP